jgi:putative membrane protein
MKIVWTGMLLAAGFILMPTAFYAGAGPSASSRDAEFVQSICNDSLTVQRIAELAVRRSQNPQVKQICRTLTEDYAKAAQQFSDLAKSIGLPIAPELTSVAARAIEKLKSVPDARFDKAALGELIKRQQAVTRYIQTESARGDNPALKQLADSSLQKLQDDIYQVVTLESDLKAMASPATGASGWRLTSTR